MKPPMEENNNDDLHLQQRQEGNDTLKSIDENSEMALQQRDEAISKLDEMNNNLELLLQQSDEQSNKVVTVKIKSPETTEEEQEHASTFYETFRGKKGEKGDKGDKGDRGEKGDSIRGEKGDRGDKGEKGRDGYTPVKGIDYVDGAKGEKGEKGEKGDTGENGKDGKDGKNGAKGKDGKDGKDVDLEVVKELEEKVNFAVSRSSKTVSLVELDDVNLDGLTKTGGKYDLGSGSGGSPASNQFNYIISKSEDDTQTIAYDVANSTILSTNTAPNIPIQAAVDAANADGGGIIGIKAGIYLISGGGTEVNMKSDVHIVGAGKGVTVIQCNTASGAAFRKVGTTVTSNFSISDMTIDELSTADVSGFLGEYIENVDFRNLEIINAGNSGATRGFGLHIGQFNLPPYTQTIVNRDIRIDNCSFGGFYSTNEEILVFNSERVQITDCTFGENAAGQGPGIGIFQWVEDIEITGCTFRDINGPSIYYSLSCNQINIHDNFFLGSQQAIMGAALSDSDKAPYEFNVHKVKGLRVENNFFKGNTSGIGMGSTEAAIITGNTFQELLNMPILIDYGTTVYTLALGTRTMATNFIIANNSFIDCNQEAEDFLSNAGILFKDATGDMYGTIKDNIFYDTRSSDITAGSFVVGDTYTITSLGTTDFTLIGASVNVVGVTFTATGAGTGTGTATGTTQRTCITFQGYYKTPAGAFNVGSIYGIMETGFDPNIQSADTLSADGVYTIVSVGTTDFTLIGAASNTVGVTFTATGPGTGTGTATPDTNFTVIGAANNDPGTIFTATGIGSGVGVAMEGLGSADATTLVAGTVYVIMAVGTTDFSTAGAGDVTPAGLFKIGTEYKIVTVGTTDYTLIGAASNTVGVVFTATGVGSGTGTATTLGVFGDMFTASGPTTGTGTVLIHKPLVYNYLNISGNRLQSNGIQIDNPIRLLNNAQLGKNVVNQDNWNINPNNFYSWGDTTGSVVVNRKAGHIQRYVLTSDIDISFADGISIGDRMKVMITQDSTGGWEATWDATNISFANGSVPVLQKTESLTESFDFVWDDTKWVEVGRLTTASDVMTVTDLPALVSAGTRSFVSDSTVAGSGNFGAIVAGGGANYVPVYYDGTNWLIG